ncbi:DUF493 domain-containing protein [Cobetia sp. cqz5-12]|jgi:putative lipoic acid-binding regulatory protein|uniref:UPF0250 protein Q4535_09780 n=1 Tax=Cobetia amphilecti TaxID=1055104 RepID=A0AAP4TXW2_9GAMM|nr:MULTISPECIES: DUF493 domain-containing protein [Cobetia]AVV33450.1 DUF493 domain-containing protein [Halomonas sp. SF2003]MBR9753822.1 DUF493 domain-containing protein [Gammaproteobacteria bacterium]NVN54999.1 DUF493 domain-containing protein [bacterium Scap17]TCJ25201.1 DUF493 domain-containing protein [Halomonas sp. GDM18]KGA03090.1 hypothetical protein KP05_02970 [Cobetia amphilecti]|tara:strand:+ start:142402 stop:142689 length:288 start_codon:yes stop_codon:yes gene_type:complete
MAKTPAAGGQTPPKIEFPCDFSLKIVGTAAEDLVEVVCNILEVHAPGFDATAITWQDSKNGNYRSIRVVIRATGTDQLDALHRDLKATGRIHMVL